MTHSLRKDLFCVPVSEASDHDSRWVRSGRWEHVVKAAHVMESKGAKEEGRWSRIMQEPCPGTYFLQLGFTS